MAYEPPGSHAPEGQTLKRRIIRRREKIDTMGVYLFAFLLYASCGGGSVRRTGRPHVALKAFQGTSYRKIRIS